MAAGAVIGLAVSVVYLDVTPSRWTATTAVFVTSMRTEPIAAAAGSPSRHLPINLDREVVRVTSDSVTLQVASQGMPIPADQLPDHVAVTVPADTSLLEIAFTADNPQTATRGANAYADAYLHARDVIAAGSIKAGIVALWHRIGAAQAGLGTATGRRAVLLRAEINAVRDQIQLTRENVPLHSAAVVDRATVPTSPGGPNHALILVGGLLLGLSLGWILARRASLLGPPGLTRLANT
jgi:polysaccharide biosynthesis transport protein